jgi:hypothetical protein
MAFLLGLVTRQILLERGAPPQLISTPPFFACSSVSAVQSLRKSRGTSLKPIDHDKKRSRRAHRIRGTQPEVRAHATSAGARGAIGAMTLFICSVLQLPAIRPATGAACACGGGARSAHPGRHANRPPSPMPRKRARPSQAIVPPAHSGWTCWSP